MIMKIKSRVVLISLFTLFASPILSGQGLLNKIKSKAQQEINSEINKAGQTTPHSPEQKNKLNASVTRTIAVTLNAGEVFDYSENCIDLGSSVNQIAFTVTQGGKCFSYKNGKRTPIECPSNNDCGGGLQCSQYKLKEINFTEGEGKQYVITKTETQKVAVPAISDQQMKMMEAYMTKEQIEATKKQLAEAAKQTQGQGYEMPINSTISFNGKQYGPFKQILHVFLTPDGKNFYSIVSEDSQMGVPPAYKIVTSVSSKVLAAPGYSPPVVIAAPDASEYAMYAITNDQKNVIITSTGKTFDLPQGALNSSWYSGGHIIALMADYTSGSKLYRDGQLIKTYGAETPDACNVFVTPDAKVTEIKSNTILFGDGDFYQYPLKVDLVNENGKNYFRWLALENREVVIYQKPN